MKFALKIKGAKEMERKLAQLPRKLARKELRAAALAGIEPIRKQAQANAPVQTGELRRSIRKRSRSSGGDMMVQVYSNARQALWTEFGTKRMAPRPWARPAVDSQGNEAIAAFARRLGTGLQRALGR